MLVPLFRLAVFWRLDFVVISTESLKRAVRVCNLADIQHVRHDGAGGT